MENKTNTNLSPTLIDPDKAEVTDVGPIQEDGSGTGAEGEGYESIGWGPEIVPEGGALVESPKSDLPKKFGYYFGEYALAQLALEMDVPPDRQQEVLRQYAKKVVEAVFEEVKCPESTGVLLNLDFPTDLYVFKNQLRDLLGGVKNMGELAELGREDFELCQNLIVRIRNEVIRLVERGLEEKGLDRKVGVKGRKFGEGGIGKVFACRLGDRNMAAKLIKWGMDERLTYHQYPELIEATRESENLVRYGGSLEFGGEESGRLDFFEELPDWLPMDSYWAMREGSKRVSGESLRIYLQNLFLPALSGLKALHGHHLLHGDIKAANILVSGIEEKPSVKLGDYDLVRRSGYSSKDGVISGSPAWMSPEQFQGHELTEKTDIFSMGMILYYALGGVGYEDFMEQGRHVMWGLLDVSRLKGPKPLRELVERCLRVDPSERPTADELIQRVKGLLEGPDFRIGEVAQMPSAEEVDHNRKEAA